MSTGARVIALEGDTGILRIRETDLPDPGPGQVLLSIYAAGVGRAQLHGVQDPPPGLTLAGGEAVARVVAIGEGVVSVAAGDVVVVTPFAAELPGEPVAIPVELEDGELTEPAALFTYGTSALVDQRYIVPMEDMPDRDAAAIFGHTLASGVAAVRQAGVAMGASVAVFGVSGAGLGAVLAAKMAGATTIVAADRDERRLDLARSLGATHTVSSAPNAAAEEVREATAGRGIDAAIDCLYDYRAKERPALRVLAPEGRAILLASPGTEVEASEAAAVAAEGFEGLGSVDAAAIVADLRRWAGEGHFAPAAITNRYTIEAVNEAVRDLENGDVVGQAVIVMEPLR